MAYGSTFGVSPGDRFFEERGYYTSGTFYKRGKLTYAQRLTRQSLQTIQDRATSAARSVFSQTSASGEQASILAAEQARERIVSAARSSSRSVNLLV